MWVSMWWTGKYKGMGIEIYSVGMMAKDDKWMDFMGKRKK